MGRTEDTEHVHTVFCASCRLKVWQGARVSSTESYEPDLQTKQKGYLWAPRRRCRCPPPSPRQSHACASFVKPRLHCHCLLRILRAELEGVHSQIQALWGNCTTYATRSSAAMNRKEQWYMDRSTVLYTPSQRRKPSLAKPVPVILELRRPRHKEARV